MNAKNLVFAVFGTIFKIAVTVVVVIAIYSAATTCYDYGYRIFTEPAVALGNGRNVTVIVPEKMSPLKIGELFEQEGLVRDGKLFALQYLLSEYHDDVKSGTFVLNTSMTAEDMMAVMASKDEKVPENTALSGEKSSEEDSADEQFIMEELTDEDDDAADEETEE